MSLWCVKSKSRLPTGPGVHHRSSYHSHITFLFELLRVSWSALNGNRRQTCNHDIIWRPFWNGTSCAKIATVAEHNTSPLSQRSASNYSTYFLRVSEKALKFLLHCRSFTKKQRIHNTAVTDVRTSLDAMNCAWLLGTYSFKLVK